MKKKLMMVAVLLGALSLGACVDNNESASVDQNQYFQDVETSSRCQCH